MSNSNPAANGDSASSHNARTRAALRDDRLDAAVAHLRDAVVAEPQSAALHHQLGVALLRQKQFDAAIAAWQQALALHPDGAGTHLYLANAYRDVGRRDDAIRHYREAARLRSDLVEAHFQLGETLRQAGQFPEAEASYRHCLRLQPDSVEMQHSLGLVQEAQGKNKKAEVAYRTALRLQPRHRASLNRLGLLLESRRRRREAVACFRESLTVKPDADVHNYLGVSLSRLTQRQRAVQAFQQAIRLNPDHADAHANLGMALLEQNLPERAVVHFEEAARLQPHSAEAHDNLGNAFRDLGEVDRATSCFREALRLKPDYPEAHANLGIAYLQTGDVAEALKCLDQAIQLRPEYPGARHQRAMVWLSQGSFQQGWPEFECRLLARGARRRKSREPRWDGSPLNGRTICLHAEQRLGDVIQLIRYALKVKQRDGRVVVHGPRSFMRLLAGCPGIDELVCDGLPLPHFDFQAPLLSLPGNFRTDEATIPAEVPYLFPEAGLLRHWHASLKHLRGFKVGIAWQGSREFRDHRQRSIPLRQFAALARLPGVQLISLQKGPGSEQLDQRGDDFPILDLGRFVDGQGAFTDTAAIIKQLDLVVTSDTSIAHLAGALAKPVWVALPFCADWRWLRDRDDTPWYPTMRLFRQKARGNWDEVFARIAVKLAEKPRHPAAAGGEARVEPAIAAASGDARPNSDAVMVEVSLGELLDKLTILQIKSERIQDAAKVANVRIELAVLEKACAPYMKDHAKLASEMAELKQVNESLWAIEDDVRDCERRGDFGERFVGLARAVYQTNDRRAALKRAINQLCGSRLVEEKHYQPTSADP